MDFSLFYRKGPIKEAEIHSLGNWDLFISAYNESDRLQTIFSKIRAKSKYWLVHSQYNFKDEQLPSDGKAIIKAALGTTESEVIRSLFSEISNHESIDTTDLKTKSICIDSTGFLRPHLMFLLLYCYKVLKVETVDILYSEPEVYKKAENTVFSTGSSNIRYVDGFANGQDSNFGDDLLVVGAGFEKELLEEIVDDKSHARKSQIVGFPPLQPDMYQQCLLKTTGIEVSSEEAIPRFAPANDPFATASVLSEIFEEEHSKKKVTNLYLTPLGTKAQVVGFSLFYIHRFIENPESLGGGVLFPFREAYSQETSDGFSKAWRYTVEFPIQEPS